MAPIQDTLPTLTAGTSTVFKANLFDTLGNPVTDPAILALVTLVWSVATFDVSVSSSGVAGDLSATVTAAPTAPSEVVTLFVAFAAPLADGSNASGNAPLPLAAVSPVPPPPVAVASIVIVPA